MFSVEVMLGGVRKGVGGVETDESRGLAVVSAVAQTIVRR